VHLKYERSTGMHWMNDPARSGGHGGPGSAQLVRSAGGGRRLPGSRDRRLLWWRTKLC